MEAVSELTHNKTVIMIAHRLKTVRNADRISVVEHGEIVQQGAHDELVAAQRWIAKATTTVNNPQKYWIAFVLVYLASISVFSAFTMKEQRKHPSAPIPTTNAGFHKA